MVINNKIESSRIIDKLELNRFPEKIFKAGEEKQVKKFIDEYPVEYYAIRDKTRTDGIFN